MSNVPADLKYTRTHEWVRDLEDGTFEVGITDHAQHALGDLVFVEVPEVGRQLTSCSWKCPRWDASSARVSRAPWWSR